MINDIIKYNRVFVSKQGYKDYVTSKYPDKKIAVISCMDTRLTELLPAALGAKNGDIKIIKNAGGVISNPFGSVVRSILIAIFELGVDTILVIGPKALASCIHLPCARSTCSTTSRPQP
ncbi:MAG: hypothetical protein IJ988_02290 [Firmicutes bacterium]|nr:hypothetical protein [Bacillota bacterium]